MKWIEAGEVVRIEKQNDQINESTWLIIIDKPGYLPNLVFCKQISLEFDTIGFPVVIIKSKNIFYKLTRTTVYSGINSTSINSILYLGYWLKKDGKKSYGPHI